jgi:hypothetical protein
MNKDSFYSEPDVILTMKCFSCRETLIVSEKILTGLGQCLYCNRAIDKEEALQSAIASTIVHRAIALANTIQTGWLAMLIFLPSAIGAYLMDWKIMFVLFVLLPSIGASLAVIRWCYRYADLHIEEEEFMESKSVMKLHLHGWLAYITIQSFVLFIW